MPDEPSGSRAEARRAVLALAGRLVVAGLLCAAIALLCWVVLPRFGAYVPIYVPALAFAVILGAALFRARDELEGDDGDHGHEEPGGVAGRIGPESSDDPDA